MYRVTLYIGPEFHPVEDEIRDGFLLSLFKGGTYQILGKEVTGFPVNHAEIALIDPTQTTGDNWTASCVITGHLVAALHGAVDFKSGGHALLMGKGRNEI